VRVTCEHCGETIQVSDLRQINYRTRQASRDRPGAYLITQTNSGGTWLIHRCLVPTEDERGGRDTSVR